MSIPLQPAGPGASSDPVAIEQAALRLGVWASLVIAVAGVVAYALSASDALLLDGLYAGVMALTSLVAARIGAVVQRPAERSWPLGYGGQEALFVLFRSLLLIGMLSVAVMAAVREIVAWLGGGPPPAAVQLGPVGIYTALSVALCLLLAWRQQVAWQASGRHSELLLLESRAAALDGAITAGAGAALLSAPLLAGTRLEPLVPLTDPVLVILIALVVMVEPLQHFVEALRQTAGAACDPALIASSRAQVLGLLAEAGGDTPVALLEFSLQKLGRTTFLMAWLDPARPVDAAWMDGLRRRIELCCGEALGPLRCELLLTRQSPFGLSELPNQS
ncbi:MAG: cation transporter [Cyanobacteriota bacterium]|nr:cation transporter [Cyanobacteriota bacterium]